MEHIVQKRIYGEAQNAAPPLKLSPLMLMVGIMLMGLALITVGTRTLAQYPVPPLDLFSPFADIFPGQPFSAVEARGFLCQTRPFYSDHTQENSEVYCTAASSSGDFLMIRVIISNSIIRQSEFLLRDNALRVGELEMMLGTTGFKAKPYGIVFDWHGSIGLASSLARVGGVSPFRPVWNITFMDRLPD